MNSDYYNLGQTSKYTGNSPWCYSYEKSLRDSTDQFGSLLNTDVKTYMVSPCHPHHKRHHPDHQSHHHSHHQSHHHSHHLKPSPAPRPSSDYSGVY